MLQGVDGIVFVADSQAEKMEDNLESLENLKANLIEYGRDIESIPIVFQWNKRDLPTALSLEEMQVKMNQQNAPVFEAVAATGEGVFPTLKALASMVLESINRDKNESSLANSKVRAARRAEPQKVGAGAPAGNRPSAPARPARPTPSEPAPAARPSAMAKPRKRAEPAGRPVNRPIGRVQIKERTDSTRLVVSVVIGLIILGAAGFLAWKFLGQ